MTLPKLIAAILGALFAWLLLTTPAQSADLVQWGWGEKDAVWMQSRVGAQESYMPFDGLSLQLPPISRNGTFGYSAVPLDNAQL